MVETIFGGFLFEFVPSSAALFQRLLENAQASWVNAWQQPQYLCSDS